ncbi:hypothetical protein SMGD1_0644 [Sulfurimonas gotlandica GD1]|uniref:Cardiolipin synthase N-terminal domain-containing protein n=1 Tax=Sulfurimonas gotlandica (strain DSM 19862 / JCM 16533 / GD1) TaxID=929558 RepID=B6BKW0_SULGG|nr:PLDc N-terminal domain-containing protein [Sulfurimonas gotlandica]EDZ62416.1 hypothetical protein CBGD1_332 [Sulfurimonas gotlandica GD1]EHP29171.1 hypothetical protein SMGD1_0644 [Sulfurimonas gotlandica GD1]
MSNITILILVLFLGLWIYSIGSILTNEFNDKKAKVFWVIGIIFVPVLAFFYIFMKKNLLAKS